MKRTIIIGLLLIGYILHASNLQLVFRFDDFLLKNNSLNEAVLQIFQKHKIPLVLGVIPYNLEEKIILQENYTFLPFLKNGVKNKSIEIAQHGFNHQNLITGEFRSLNKSEQYRRIHKGKAILDSIFDTKIVTFIPPWNKYDVNTLSVMEEVGLKNLSSALCIEQPWTNPNINYFPITIEDFRTLYSVLENNKKRKGVVAVMFHYYSINKSFSLEQLDNILNNIKKLSYVNCLTFVDLYEKNVLSDEKRMNANMEINLLSKNLHLGGVLQSTKLVNVVRILNLLLYLTVGAILYFISLLIFLKHKSVSNKIKFITGLILLIIIGLSVWFHVFGPLKTFAFMVLLTTSFILAKIKILQN